MAYSSISDALRVVRQISSEDKQFLSELGFDVAAFIGNEAWGSVFSGVCNWRAIKSYPIGPNEIRTAVGDIQYDPIARSYVRNVNLNGRSCAIKMYHRGGLERNEFTDKLHNEAKIMTELEHPNIVEIYSVCKTPNYIYIIMEFLNSGSIDKFIDSLPFEAKLDEWTALQMIRQMTSGLQYLHNKGIVHGDLHSENIMISTLNNNFQVKIVDFGNSKPLAAKNNMNDITALAYHFRLILDKSLFQRTAIEGNLKAVVNMMSNRVFSDMNQVVDHFNRYLPESDVPPPPNSIINKLTKLFSKK